MSKKILLVMYVLLAGAAIFFFCTSPKNPFNDSNNSKIYLALKDSNNRTAQSLSLTDTIGNTESIGVCPYLYSFVDSVTITILTSSNDTDTAFVVRNFVSDADTQWYDVTFRSKGTMTVKVMAYIRPATQYPLTGVIAVLPAKIVLADMPQTVTVSQDSSTFLTVSVASGHAPYRFQWFHESTAVTSIRTSSLANDTFFIRNAAFMDSGMYSCIVLDEWGDSAKSTTTALKVASTPVVRANRKPSLHVSGRINILNTEICSLTVSTDDPDSGQVLTVSLIKGPASDSFANNLFTWHPSAGYLGTDTAIFVVKDNGTPVLSDTARIAIHVTATILPPDSVRGVTGLSRINGVFVFKWSKVANADAYAIYRSRDTSGFVLLTTVPDTMFTNAIGDTAFYYYVTATNSAASSPRSQLVHSTAINTAPKWSHDTISISMNRGASFSFTCSDSCKDANGDAVSYSLVLGGPTTDSLTAGIWKYAPSSTDSGPYQAKIKAWDGMDSSLLIILLNITVVNSSLSAPTLVLPADGAVDQVLSPLLVWNRVAAASTYSVQIASDSSFASIVDSDSMVTDTTRSVTGILNGATYYWRVKSKNAISTSAWSSRRSFTTILSIPSTPVLSTPANNASGEPLSTSLTWGIVSSATSYEVQVSTAADFATGVIADDSSLTTVSKAIVLPSNSTNYYWRVRAKNAGGLGNWSAPFNFTTIVATAGVPTLLTPANSATSVPLSITLSWGAVSGSTAYLFQVATTSDFSAGVIIDDSVASPAVSKAISLSLNNQQYYWRVKAKNAGGSGTWSAVSAFTTVVSASAVPVLTAPTSNATNVAVAPTLTWNVVTGAATYRVQISTVNTFATIYVQDSTLTAGSKAISGLSNSTKYFWRVNATNAGGTSAWTTDSFTTIIGTPAVPVLTAPADNATNVAVAPTLTWNAVTGAATYRVQVSTVNTFATIYVQDSTLTNGSKAFSGLSNSTKYFWRVNATNAGGTSAWATDSFTTIIGGPAVPVLTVPTDNAVNVSVTPALTWNTVTGAATYRVQVSTASDFSSVPVVDDSTLTTGTKTTSSLANNTQYYWRVNAKNIGGTSAWSTARHFTTMPAAPTISTQPLGQTANVGGKDTLNVTAAGSALSYAWHKKGADTTTKSTTAMLIFANLAYSDSGYYYVVVSNAGGNITSDSAKMTVHDNVPPTVVLKGKPDTAILLNASGTYTDPGLVSATDDRDGSVLGTKTQVGATVNLGVVGKYVVKWQVVDLTGNKDTASRTVRVMGWKAMPDIPVGGTGDHTSFSAVQTANGDLYVAYIDPTVNAVYVKKYIPSSNTWQAVGGQVGSASGTQIQMGLSWDKTIPYVAYYSGTVSVFKYNTTSNSWDTATSGTPGNCTNSNYYSNLGYSFKISPNGTPYMVTNPYGGNTRIYKTYSPSLCWDSAYTGQNDMGTAAATPFFLEMNAQGNAYVLYSNNSGTQVLYNNGTYWNPLWGLPDASLIYGIVMDESTPAIPYVLSGSEVWTPASGTWASLGTIFNSGGDASLVYSSYSKNIYVGYIYSNGGDTCYIKEYSGGSWNGFPQLTSGKIPVSNYSQIGTRICIGQSTYFMIYPKNDGILKIGGSMYQVIQ
jgi:hypothetical protein